MRLPRRLALALLLLTAASRVEAADPRVDDVAWLAGCWAADSPARTVEEQWLKPAGGLMLSMGRTVVKGEAREYEFIVLRAAGGRLAYEAHPSEQAAATFLSTTVTDSRVVFENPSHDFPQQVGYELNAPDRLSAWIEGNGPGGNRRVDFEYRRVVCPGSDVK